MVMPGDDSGGKGEGQVLGSGDIAQDTEKVAARRERIRQRRLKRRSSCSLSSVTRGIAAAETVFRCVQASLYEGVSDCPSVSRSVGQEALLEHAQANSGCCLCGGRPY